MPVNASSLIDSVIDVRAIFQQGHRALDVGELPTFLLPYKGKYGVRDYEKMFCADPTDGHDIFNLSGMNRPAGCVVIVRPDQHIAHVLPLGPQAELTALFDGILVTAQRKSLDDT